MSVGFSNRLTMAAMTARQTRNNTHIGTVKFWLEERCQWNSPNDDNKDNEKRDNKQCLLNTPRRITVYHKNYFDNKISSCKCPMDGCTS